MVSILLVFVTLFCAVEAQATREPWPVDFLADADLHDVFFIDANNGWAVGDRGVILHSSDGGSTWNHQQSPAGDSLYGVHFLDAQNGWAVGGSAVPHTRRGRGVVLHTDNGGRTWLVEKVRTLPALREVRFFDKQNGVAIGDATSLYPAAAFTTRDGGRTWNPFPVRTAHGWTAADFRPTGRGLLLGSDGRITTCDGPNCRARSTPPLNGSGTMRDIAWIDDNRAIAVGDGARVWLSPDAGASWHDMTRRIAPDDSMDFLTVASDGTRIWIGGRGKARPADSLSSMLRSSDAGETWQTVSVPTTLPISKIAYDQPSGQNYAVGSLGQILRSPDRGATWQVVRGRDRRLFALAVFDEATKIPWPLVAQIGAGYGGRLRVVVANHKLPTALAMTASEQVHQAALVVGANGADSIRTAAKADEVAIAKSIQASVQTWQPSLVITGGNRTFTNTVATAAQITNPSLPVWKTDWSTKERSAGTITIANAELAPSLGASVGLLTANARSILNQPVADREMYARCFPISTTGANLPTTGERITSGFNFAVGSPSRRSITSTETDRRSLEQAAQQHALLQQLIRRAVADPERGAAWLAQAENMATSLTPTAAANVLYDLANQQFATGDVTSATATLNSIVSKHPTSGVFDAALRDAVLWSASREVAYRRSKLVSNSDSETLVEKTRTAVQPAAYESGRRPEPEVPVRRGTSVPLDRLIKGGPTIADQMRVRPATIATTLPNTVKTDPVQPLLELPTWLERMGPEHRADPDVQLAIESHRRRIHKPGVRQEAVFKRLARTLPGKWRDCAAAELALLKPDRNAAKPVLAGRFGDRPRLDGRLDIADKTTWPDFSKTESQPRTKHASLMVPLVPRLPLTSGATEVTAPPAIVLFAADEQFLYIAIRCEKQPGTVYPAGNTPRTHDADLSQHDRVDISIDTDRDYSLAWRLTIDHRGWTGESLASDTSWNPKWYVAAADEASSPTNEWICEAAIAWSELADSHPTPENPWGINVVRHLPDGQQVQWPPVAGKPQQLEHAGLFSFGPR